jgi:hypothetical protein
MSASLTPSRLAQLRRDAKRLARSQPLSHAQALDAIAHREGFSNWSLLAKLAGRAPAQPDAPPATSILPQELSSEAVPRAMPVFAATHSERSLIERIVQRFLRIMEDDWKGSRLSLLMDLEACHCNGCALDLQGLLDAPRDGDVAHDVAGISQHLDRSTGRLTRFFLPRYALRTELSK